MVTYSLYIIANLVYIIKENHGIKISMLYCYSNNYISIFFYKAILDNTYHCSQTIEFWREADILSKLHHPNVVAFYGVVQDGPGGTLATVAEFMVDGSLRHVLLRKDR